MYFGIVAGKKFTHPDDPINHLHVIEKDLLNMISNKDPPVFQGCDPRPEGYVSEGLKKDDLSATRPAGYDKEEQEEYGISGGRKSEDAKERLMDESDQCNISSDVNRTLASNQKSDGYSKMDDICQKSTNSDSKRKHKEQHVDSPSENLPTRTQGTATSTDTNTPKPVRQLQGRVQAVPLEQIERNRLTVDEIRQLDRFKNYTPGTPSKVSYLSVLYWTRNQLNLAKCVIFVLVFLKYFVFINRENGLWKQNNKSI